MLHPQNALAGANPTSRRARFTVEAVEGQYFYPDDGTGRQSANGLYMGFLDVTIPEDWSEWYREKNQKIVLDEIGAIVRAHNLKHGTTLTCLYNVLKSTTVDASPVSGTGQLSVMHAHMHEDGQMKWTDSDSIGLVMMELHMNTWSTGRLAVPTLLIGNPEHFRKWRYAKGYDYHVSDKWQESSMPAWPVRESDRFPSSMPMMPL